MSALFEARRPRATDWRRLVTRGSVSPAALTITAYALLLLSRAPEMFSFILGFRPILLLVLVTMALAFTLPRARLGPVLSAPESRAVIALSALALITVPTSVWPGGSFRFVVLGFSKIVLFFFLLLYCVRRGREVRYLVLAFVGAVAVLELGVLLFNARERVRITGTYDPNDLAFVMVCALPVAIMLLIVERGPLRYALPPLVMLGLLTIIMTKSRGGFISLIVVGAIVLAKLPTRIPLLRSGLLIGGVLVFGLLAPQSYWDRITTIWSDGEEEIEQTVQGKPAPSPDDYLKSGLTSRWKLWMTGVRLMLENPILGVGANAFALAERGQSLGGAWRTAHNSFTQIGAELGFAGLALFCYLLYRAIRNCRTVIRIARRTPQLEYHLWTAHGFEAAIYGYIIAGAGLSHAYSNVLYYLLAVTMILKWLTLEDRARLDATTSGARDAVGSLPWWKTPR